MWKKKKTGAEEARMQVQEQIRAEQLIQRNKKTLRSLPDERKRESR